MSEKFKHIPQDAETLKDVPFAYINDDLKAGVLFDNIIVFEQTINNDKEHLYLTITEAKALQEYLNKIL